MTDYEQYLICKERGHTMDTMRGAAMDASYNSVAKYTCKYCGTTYWTTTKTIQREENTPTPTESKP